jgi:hypothetical protein
MKQPYPLQWWAARFRLEFERRHRANEWKWHRMIPLFAPAGIIIKTAQKHGQRLFF